MSNRDLKKEFNHAVQRVALRIKTPADTLSILNPAFKYTPAAKTNIEETFKRIRKEIGLGRPKS